MKIYSYPETALAHENIPNLLENWRMIGIYLELHTSSLSYLHQKGVKDKLIRLSKKAPKRDTYKSLDPLLRVQNRVALLLNQYYYKLPNSDVMQAYIKGQSPYDFIKEHMTGCKLLGQCDIKGYFDSIKHQDIFDAMKKVGFPNLGAKTIANACTMKKKIGANRHGRGGRFQQVLQQGSPCSPVVSNFVGYFQIDQLVLAWLESYCAKYPKMTYKYMRYCDNLYVAFDGEVPLVVKKDCTESLISILKQGGRRTHKWDWTMKSHPRRHQRILGVIVNEKMRIDRDKYQALRGLLFNLCSKGIENTLPQYFNTDGISLPDAMIKTDRTLEKLFYQKVQGGIAFTKKINDDQYRTLTKLLQAGKFLNRYWTTLGKDHRSMKGYADIEGNLVPHLFEAVKLYNDKEGIAPYVKRIKDICEQIEQAYQNRDQQIAETG